MAFLEDMEHIRDIASRLETSRGELRRISSVLRRFLIEGDISRVAAPRVGRVELLAPDNKPFYSADEVRLLFFGSGGAKVFGVEVRALCMGNAGQAKPGQSAEERVKEATQFLLGQDLHAVVSMRIDNFLAQRVLCYAGNWVDRRAAIKYVAHVASGVHSGAPVTEEDKLVERIRTACSYSVEDGNFKVHMLPELGANSANVTFPPNDKTPPLNFEVSALDPVLVELLTAAHFLAISPDILRLEEIVRKEVSGRS